MSFVVAVRQVLDHFGGSFAWGRSIMPGGGGGAEARLIGVRATTSSWRGTEATGGVDLWDLAPGSGFSLFPAEMFADCSRTSGTGPVPPMIVAVVIGGCSGSRAVGPGGG